jgi:hypothetical protein
MGPKEREALKVACPLCKQPVGKTCQTVRGPIPFCTRPHPARIRAAGDWIRQQIREEAAV